MSIATLVSTWRRLAKEEMDNCEAIIAVGGDASGHMAACGVFTRCADDLEKELGNVQYMELIMAVARKFPDETRQQTALRYIRDAENNCSTGYVKATPPPPESERER